MALWFVVRFWNFPVSSSTDWCHPPLHKNANFRWNFCCLLPRKLKISVSTLVWSSAEQSNRFFPSHTSYTHSASVHTGFMHSFLIYPCEGYIIHSILADIPAEYNWGEYDIHELFLCALILWFFVLCPPYCFTRFTSPVKAKFWPALNLGWAVRTAGD